MPEETDLCKQPTDLCKQEEKNKTAKEISEDIFYGIVTEEEVKEHIEFDPARGDGYNTDGEKTYSLTAVEECKKHFDPHGYLEEPVIDCFQRFDTYEDILNYVQKIICDAHQIGYYDEWGQHDERDYSRLDFRGDGTVSKYSRKRFFARLTAERYLYTAIFSYIANQAPEQEKDGETIGAFLDAMEDHYDDDGCIDYNFKDAVDILFDELELEEPNHPAVIQYRLYQRLARLMGFSKEDLMPDIVEWLCENYYYPQGYWGVRERRFADWHWRETHDVNKWYAHDGTLSCDRSQAVKEASKNTAEKYNALPTENLWIAESTRKQEQ